MQKHSHEARAVQDRLVSLAQLLVVGVRLVEGLIRLFHLLW